MRRGADGIWTRLGAAGAIPTGTGSTFFSASYLAVGPDNVPYVLFKDASNTSWHARISLVKWNGTAWVYVGGGGLSSGQANPTQLNFSSDGKPYVTYRDISSGYVAARYFDGSAWQNLGSTETIVSYTSSVGFGSFAANGDFYVALYDGSPATGKGPTVVRWNGTAWSQVGSGRIGTYAANTNGAGPQGIYVGSDGRPRIIATDMSTATTVPAVYMWKYDGSNWVREGSEIGKFSPAARVEAAPNGKIYVMYIETTDRGTTATVSYPITIKQFVGSDWVTVGSSYFDVTKNISMIAINPANNVPYLPIITQNSKVSVISPLQVLNSSTSVSANISAGAIEVGTPASIAFPSTTVSSSIQTLDFAGGVFTVEDLK